MTPTLRLGRVFGIDISGNWSLLFVFALVAWSLASGLPAEVPGRAAGEYWLAGIIGAAIFYMCLLAHELSHSLVARASGVNVSGITLWLFGGVSKLEGEPADAGAEARITVAGPITSIVLAAVFYGLALLVAYTARFPLAAGLLAWLGVINLALGLFNLVPALPLDGGRLLSSILWWRSGDRRRAVHQAARVGRVLAAVMIAIGFVEFLTGHLLNGVWTAFLGWFLLSAASAEESGVDIRELLRGVRVAAAMSSPVVTLPDWLTVEQLLLSEAPRHRFTTYPVHGPRGDLTGVVRLPDVVHDRSPGNLEKRLAAVAHPMADVPRAQSTESLAALLARLGDQLERRVLVYEGDHLVGIVSPADVGRLMTLRQAVAGGRPRTA